MRVYFFRHGQTESNRDKRVQGWTDVKLTDKGIRQAQKLRQAIEGIKFDRKIASDLYRTRQTAQILFGDDDSLEFDPRVREINNTSIAGHSIAEMVEKYGDVYTNALHGLDYSAFGGESCAELVKRVGEFLDDLARDTVSEKVAVVTHGGVIHAAVANVLGMGTNIDTKSFGIGNCTANIFEYSDGRWRLVHLNNRSEIE